MIEQIVVSAVSTVPALSGKVFPLNAKEGVPPPFCVYVSSGATENDSLGGWIGSYEAAIEINILDKTYAGMKGLSESVVAALKAIKEATVYIEENQPELYEHEIGAYRKIINLQLQY